MKTHTIGVDIGGSKIYTALFDSDWKLLRDHRCDTPTDTLEQFLKCIESCIHEVIDEKTQTIGLSFAGMIDSSTGNIVKAPNIEILSGYNLVSHLEKVFSLPVSIENDAALMTYAETHLGVAKGKNPVIGITFGTGIGAGLVINGDIYNGHQGFGMELGHTFLSENNQELEKVFGLQGMRNYLKKHTGIELLGHLHDRFPEWNAETEKIFTPLLKDISKVFYNLIILLNPEVIVISGGIGQNLFPIFGQKLQEEVDALLALGKYPFQSSFAFSTIPNSGALGAALFASKSL